MRRQTLLSAVLLVGAAATSAMAEEWPKWLGPKGNGISTDPIANHWPENGPKKIWEQKVGLGYSSPIGFEGKVYLFSQQGEIDLLTAFDANSGQVVWSKGYAVGIPADASQAKNPENGLPLPLATPTIENGRIYTYGGGGDLFCRKLDGGDEVWHVNVLTETGSRILTWNEASSPLVTEKMVTCRAGRSVPPPLRWTRRRGRSPGSRRRAR